MFWVSACTLLMLHLSIFPAIQAGAKEDDTEEAKFAAQARKLEPSNPQKDRLAALAWLETRRARPAAGKVMPEVERCLKKDADAAVRARAATVLGSIAYKRKPSICPLAVVEALQDGDSEVRDRALEMVQIFQEFAPGAVEVLLRCAKEGDRDMRAGVMTVIAAAGGQEEKAVKCLREAAQDKDFLICNNAHAALYTVTGNPQDIVPYCLRIQMEFHELSPLSRGASESQKLERTTKQLIQWGTLARLYELEGKRSEELAKIVMRELKQPVAHQRRAAAFVIGAYPDLLETLKRADSRHLLVDRDQKFKKKDAPPPLRLLDRLRTMKMEDQLRKMAKDDADKQVRAAAALALEKLTKTEPRP